jgi:PglZ domain
VTHPFHDYLCHHVSERLKNQILVVYDEREDFRPFFERELQESGTGHNGLPRVFLGEQLVFLARFTGSFFALRAAVEGIADMDKPDPLIVYVPGARHDPTGSVLMELEKAGMSWQPRFRTLALNALRKRFTDGQIDELLKPSTTYEDVVTFLAQGPDNDGPSALRTLFDGARSEPLIAAWLADDVHDGAIDSKNATDELYKLLEARIGLPVPSGTPINESRDKTVRYVLVGEFVSDLGCAAPASLSMIPSTGKKEHVDRVRAVARELRESYQEAYVALADGVEEALQLAKSDIPPGDLGSIDTFRFEERQLLTFACELIEQRRYDEALGIAAGRKRSFWVDRDVARQAQWEACRLMAELGRAVLNIRKALAKVAPDAPSWLQAYAAEGGWHVVDGLQRRLETWVVKMGEEPVGENALTMVRREHDNLLREMADGFYKAYEKAKWTISGALHQTRIYPEVVKPMGGRTAYFLVDAMRFEMGVDLAQQLQGAVDLTLRPAVCALPSITPVGMAALLPGASSSFSVVDHKGKPASLIEGSPMRNLQDRLKFLKAKVPGAVEMTLSKVVEAHSTKLAKTVADAPLVVIRSQEIDFVGEMDGDMLARQVVDTVISNVARAAKKLAAAGIECFVITADHGHQFGDRKDEDMRTDLPGGDKLAAERRCWIGRGGSNPPGTVRITGAELGYETDLDFVFPTGLGVFRAGGGLAFHHGGFSLQEIVVPVISFRIPRGSTRPSSGKEATLHDVPAAVTNRTFGVTVQVLGGLLDAGPVQLRVVLIHEGEVVGNVGMAVGGDLDRTTGILSLAAGDKASVGLMLTRDDCKTLRVVVLDPTSDAVLAQSDDIPVKLAI